MEYGENTRSPKSVVLTFCARNSMWPLKSFSTISCTRLAPKVNSQCGVIMFTPSSLQASTMSCPFVHSEVAEPCQVSPPSSSSACGRLALSCLISVLRCAKPPTLP
ncbi:hypothetical protein D9M68_930290 [compost metagenome]